MSSQFSLLQQRRFLPFFVTQFLGAFNDNLFKNAVLIILTYQVTDSLWADSGTLVNLAAGLFILPFFLFSATAGQLADKYEKSGLICKVKVLEIIIMLLGAYALLAGSITLMLATLFLLGMQSAFFGPVKFSILPQHLSNAELVGGNALVEAGTFLAILFGTIIGGILIANQNTGALLLALAGIVVALVGYWTSRRIPPTEVLAENLKIDWNVWRSTATIIVSSSKNRTVFLSILGVSWFWLYGAVVLAQLPLLVNNVLSGNEQVVTLLLAVFSVGIGMGSLWCEKLAAYRIELGLVPLGSFGLTIFALDLYWTTSGYQPATTPATRDIAIFLSEFSGWRILIDLLFMAFFGGLYIVPLNSLVQSRSPAEELSRNIAANNIINAAFMVVAAAFAALLLALGCTIPQIFLVLGLVNIFVAVYIFKRVPEFLMRLIIWLLVHTIYRLKEQELYNIPEHGAAILACNHVSFVDALIISAASRRPVRFVMDHTIYGMPLLNFVFRTAQAIPIASAKQQPKLLEQAFDKIAIALERGELVCIFPEGRITHDGEMTNFRNGIERIIARTPVPVIPIALRGLYGSFFSRYRGRAMQPKNLPGKLFAKIEIVSGQPIAAAGMTADSLQIAVAKLLN